jgi:hypothetical protein
MSKQTQLVIVFLGGMPLTSIANNKFVLATGTRIKASFIITS